MELTSKFFNEKLSMELLMRMPYSKLDLCLKLLQLAVKDLNSAKLDCVLLGQEEEAVKLNTYEHNGMLNVSRLKMALEAKEEDLLDFHHLGSIWLN